MNSQRTMSTLSMESYSRRNMYLIVLTVKMLYIYIGMMFVWTSPLIPNLEELLNINMLDKIAILALLPVGMMLGPIVGSALVPRYGFKSVFLLFGCLSLMSVVLLAFRQVWIICGARLLGGIAIGSVLCYMGAYIQDISDQEVTAVMKPLNVPFLTFGFTLVYDIGQLLLYFEMLLVLLVVPLIFLLCLTWLPESPYNLVAVGNLDKAKKSVDFLHRGISTRGLEYLVHHIQEAVCKRSPEACLPSYHQDPKGAKVTLIFFTLLPLTGFPVIFMLLETLIREAQQEISVNPSLMVISRSDFILVGFLARVFSLYCRHSLKLISSSIIMSLSMVVFGVFFFILENGQDVSDVFWMPLICIIFYTAAFLVGFCDSEWSTEEGVSDSRLRDCGRVVSLSAGYFSMSLVVLLFLPIKAALGTAPIMWAFSAFSFSMTIFLIMYTPKTALF